MCISFALIHDIFIYDASKIMKHILLLTINIALCFYLLDFMNDYRMV